MNNMSTVRRMLDNFDIGDVDMRDAAFQTNSWLMYTVLCQIINIFGILTNSINIVCFVKQGLNDSVYVSLLGLSLSDLGNLMTMLLTCICTTLAVCVTDLPFESLEFTYLVSGMPHLVFTRASSCITAMITLERCLSIAVPLKVTIILMGPIKSIVTPSRAAVIIGSMFVVILADTTPVYIATRLGVTWSLSRNKTIGIVFSGVQNRYEKIAVLVNNFSVPLSAGVIIVICTLILSVKIHTSTLWIKATSTKAQFKTRTHRNQRIAKMVIAISTAYIVCYSPINVVMLLAAFEPGLSVFGNSVKFGLTFGRPANVLESINSSMNIFIYHNMSSKYRDTFRTLFKPNTGTYP